MPTGQAVRSWGSTVDLLTLPGAASLTKSQLILLLLTAGGPHVRRAHLAASLKRLAPLEWQELFDQAVAVSAHPLLAHALATDDLATLVPASIRASLSLATLAARARWAAHVRALDPVLEQLGARQIDVVALKGAALMELYPPGSRMINDVDLWVPPHRFEEAASVLMTQGFNLYRVHGESPEAIREMYVGWVFSRPRGEAGDLLVVDLHYRLHAQRSIARPDIGRWIDRTGWTTIGSHRVRALRREDAIVHLACQVASDKHVPIQRLADVVTLIEAPSQSALDWTAVVTEAVLAQASGGAGVALVLASLAGARVGVGVLDELLAANPGCEIARSVLLDLRAFFPTFALRAAASLAIEVSLAPSGTRRRTIASIPSTIKHGARLAGAPSSRSVMLAVRAIPLVAMCWSIASIGAAARRRSRKRLVDRLNGLLWRSK